MDNLPVIIAEVSVAPSGESFRNTFFFCACFRRFTVGSIKTRQITLWAVGLITTNHDMRPIRLTMWIAEATTALPRLKTIWRFRSLKMKTKRILLRSLVILLFLYARWDSRIDFWRGSSGVGWVQTPSWRLKLRGQKLAEGQQHSGWTM